MKHKLHLPPFAISLIITACLTIKNGIRPVEASSSPHSSDALEAARFGPLPPTVFAPGGRLHGVERVAREAYPLADDESSCAVIALRSGSKLKRRMDGADDEEAEGEFAIISGIGAISPFLHRDEVHELDPDSNNTDKSGYQPLVMDYDGAIEHDSPPTPISIISSNIVAGVGGKGIDSAVLLRRVAEASLSMYKSDNGGVEWFVSHSLEGVNDNAHPSPIGGAARVEVKTLARKMADLAQSSTQSLGGKSGRMLSVSHFVVLDFLCSCISCLHCNISFTKSSLLAVGLNEQVTPHQLDDGHIAIWRIDPTGQFWRLDASAVGRAAINVESELVNKVRSWKIKDTKQLADQEPSEVGVTNTDVKTYLASLSVEEALTVANDCLVHGIMSSMTRDTRNLHSNGILDSSLLEKGLRKRIRTAIIRTGPFGVSKSYIELVRG